MFVGASASVVRAGVMGILLVLGPAFGRRSMALNAMAIAALLMALQSPAVLWDVSFQLSFAATLGLIVLATPLSAAFRPWLIRRLANVPVREIIALVADDLWVTVAATLATLPILAYDFQRISLVSLPVNFLVLPAQTAIMATGFLVILGGLIHPVLGQAAGWLAWPFLVWTTGIVEWAGSFSFASLDSGSLPQGLMVGYYVLLVLGALFVLQPAAQRAQWRAALPSWPALVPVGALALLGFLVWALAVAQPDGLLHVSFLDVGQGNATLVKTPGGQVAAIDGGPGAGGLIDAVGRSVPFTQREVALGVLTRASEEDLAGLVSLLERYRVGRLIAPAVLPAGTTAGRWRELVAAQGIALTAPVEGERIELGDGVELEVVQVSADSGLALRLRYGRVSIYFEGEGAPAVLPDEAAAVLRVGRHGDSQAASQALLDALSPQWAVISLGANPPAGEPSADTLARLAGGDAVVYRTDLNGDISFTSDGERVWVQTER